MCVIIWKFGMDFLVRGLTPGAASGKLCVDDSFTPQTYYSTNQRLSVRFFADRLVSKRHRGFTATYTQLNFTPPGMSFLFQIIIKVT